MFLVYYEDLFHYASAATITAAITAAIDATNAAAIIVPAGFGQYEYQYE